MRYERPMIVRRERIAGLLLVARSDTDTDTDFATSDANLKENVAPVTWSEPRRLVYENPAIARHDRVAGLLDFVRSDFNHDVDATVSDVHLKENVVPVVW